MNERQAAHNLDELEMLLRELETKNPGLIARADLMPDGTVRTWISKPGSQYDYSAAGPGHRIRVIPG